MTTADIEKIFGVKIMNRPRKLRTDAEIIGHIKACMIVAKTYDDIYDEDDEG